MSRRCMVWILCVLLLTAAVLGFAGCKEEEEALQQETAEEQAAPGATMSDTTDMEDKTGDFEEEEGVQQESPSQYDY